VKVVIFLGPPRLYGRRKPKLRYRFEQHISAPIHLLGVALFRWLCAERGIPEQVVIFGGERSNWDALHELAAVDEDMPAFAALRLRESISYGGVDQGTLDRLETFLSDFLSGVDVRCVLTRPVRGAGEQLRFFEHLDEHFERGDELHVDVSRDLWACGLFGSASAAFLAQGRAVHIAGIYVSLLLV